MRYLKIAANWLITLGVIWIGIEYFDRWWPLVQDSPIITSITGGGLLSSILFSIRRRVTTVRPTTDFFSRKALMIPPENKFRYSDRMAYILAEMSELAYYEVERADDNFVRFLEQARNSGSTSQQALDRLIKLYKEQTRSSSIGGAALFNEQDLEILLNKHGFQYQPPYLNCGSAQGFICYHNGADPYIVVAFRGSEKKVEDWLTNVDAVPMPESEVEKGKVHGGFYRDFDGLRTTIESSLYQIRQELGDYSVPVFFTGHSLGGALATIATRELMPNDYAACYTYGAPRVGDYTYFEFVKTPIYRVVNSSDIVPRVPPGAWTSLILKLLTFARYLTVRIDWANALIVYIEGWFDRLKYYRHFGDQRYLTDVNADDLGRVMLLRNPNHLDVLQWFWRHIMVSYGMPVKSHSMTIYRKKLAEVGMKRINKKAMRKSFSYFA